jgi:hypothetical protein
MAHDFETPSSHDPALSRQHAAGPAQDRLSPAERALAPEARAPMQSASAVADDGTYVGRTGGYVGGAMPSAGLGGAPVDTPNTLGESTYGYPAGPGVGFPGGEHQPEGLPDPYGPSPEDLLPPEPTVVANKRLQAREKGSARQDAEP